MVTEDQDILDQIAELRRQKAAELQAMQSDNNPIGLALSGALGGLADYTAAGAGMQGGYTDKALTAYQTGAKGRRDMRLKALEGSGEEIKALNELAKSRATDRKTLGLYEQQTKLAQLAEAGRDNRDKLDRESRERIEAGRLASKPAPKGMKYEVDPQTGEKTLVQAEKTPSELNSSDKQRYDNVVMANDAIKGMADSLAAGGSRYSLVGDNDYTMNLAKFEEALGRMQSGGAIQKEEAKRFAALARSFGDDPSMQVKKLKDLQTIMRDRFQTLGFDPAKNERFAYEIKSPAKSGFINQAQATDVQSVSHPDPAKEARRQALINKAAGKPQRY